MIDVTNEDFLRAIFGDEYNHAWVTGFECSPHDANGRWAGAVYAKRKHQLTPNSNTFYAISLFMPLAGDIHRRKNQFKSAHVIMIDDVGTKIDRSIADIILPEPSYVIETSRNNYQYGYVLASPETRLYAVEQFQHGLISLGLSKDNKDPGMFGVTRYCRLPVGTNTKQQNAPWPHVLVAWNPGTKYYLDDLALELGIELTEQPSGTNEYRMVEASEDYVYQCLIKSHAVKAPIVGKPGAYDITCPWVEEHTKQLDNGTAYFAPGYSDGTYVYTHGGYKCHHGHCEDKTLHDLRLHYAQLYPDMLPKLLRTEMFQPYHDSIVELDEMRINKWITQEPPIREWVFTNVMPLGKVCLLVAAGGTGKSFMTLQLAASIATGTPFGGFWMPPSAGSVLCIYAEEDREELHRRFYSIRNEMSMDKLDAELLSKHVFIASSITKDKTNPNRFLSPSGTGFIHTNNVIALINHGKKIKEQTGSLRAIILDPLVRFYAGNENDSNHATQFMEVVEYIAKTLNTTIIIPHHQNKVTMKDVQQTQSASRGSSAFTDAARWQANLRCMHEAETAAFGIPEDQHSFYVQLAVTKNNYGAPHPPIWLRREHTGALMQCTLQKATGRTATNAVLLPKILEKIEYEMQHGRHYTQKQFINEFSGEDGIIGAGQRRMTELVLQGIDAGYITHERRGKVLTLITRQAKADLESTAERITEYDGVLNNKIEAIEQAEQTLNHAEEKRLTAQKLAQEKEREIARAKKELAAVRAQLSEAQSDLRVEESFKRLDNKT